MLINLRSCFTQEDFLESTAEVVVSDAVDQGIDGRIEVRHPIREFHVPGRKESWIEWFDLERVQTLETYNPMGAIVYMMSHGYPYDKVCPLGKQEWFI
jgi:hypothetical protein